MYFVKKKKNNEDKHLLWLNKRKKIGSLTNNKYKNGELTLYVLIGYLL